MPSAPIRPSDVYVKQGEKDAGIPIWLFSDAMPLDQRKDSLGDVERRWLQASRFTTAAKKQALIPAPKGHLAHVALGLGNGAAGEPCGASELLVGQLASSLPPGTYHLTGDLKEAELAAIAWGLGAYRFRRYKNGTNDEPAKLKMPKGVDEAAILNEVEAVWLGRDLINTPASDMGPLELELAARDLAQRHGAAVTSIIGEELLNRNFPMIHAVGRASEREPRLIDITWEKPGVSRQAPKITLIGKGICFDTGGLDIKPSSGMLLMKKDMGGAATALALGHMIMGQNLDVRLRILIPAAENSISGNAFRPGDVLKSRSGKTVEIGNTDAEGRLVLADAITLATEQKPDTVLVFATLTGAARAALGPDLPAFFCDDHGLANDVLYEGQRLGDPVWRMPFWSGYERHLDSDVADMNNVYDSPFAGAITAALFLRRFASGIRRFAHFDIFGWRPAARPICPKGGEIQAARAVFSVLRKERAL
jgi:leucyl aminopeptidase